ASHGHSCFTCAVHAHIRHFRRLRGERLLVSLRSMLLGVFDSKHSLLVTCSAIRLHNQQLQLIAPLVGSCTSACFSPC
ncbi:unnamed protein product, partial [Linum tenue]